MSRAVNPMVEVSQGKGSQSQGWGGALSSIKRIGFGSTDCDGDQLEALGDTN